MLWEEIEYVVFVELMYVMWMFDLCLREGFVEFSSWTCWVVEE